MRNQFEFKDPNVKSTRTISEPDLENDQSNQEDSSYINIQELKL